jgi:hypothetical protein
MDNIIATLDEAYQINNLHPQHQPIYIRMHQAPVDPPSLSDITTVLPTHVHVDPSSLTVHPLPGSETGTMKATARLLQQSRGVINPPSTTIRESMFMVGQIVRLQILKITFSAFATSRNILCQVLPLARRLLSALVLDTCHGNPIRV